MGGANFSSMHDPLGMDHGPHAGRAATGAGYVVGVGFEPEHARPFGICVEALFAQRPAGYAFDESGGGYPIRAFDDGSDRGRRSMRCRVVEVPVPVMLVYRRWHGLRLELGPYCSHLLKATDSKRGSRIIKGVEVDLDERVDRTASLAPWEFGGLVGVQVEGSANLHMDVRYKLGFTDLDRAAGSSPSYTHQFQIALVYDLL